MKLTYSTMEVSPWLDGALGILALAIVLAGLWMLINGVRGMGG